MIRISLSKFRLEVFDKEDELLASFPISWSKFGVGFAVGSKKTPLGRFRICEKIGAGEPLGVVFVARVPVGEMVAPATGGPVQEGKVLTRILWLDGLDKGNANTKDRLIYIHGTINEHLIPSQTSDGCIVLKNDDVIKLFDMVDVDEKVEILI